MMKQQDITSALSEQMPPVFRWAGAIARQLWHFDISVPGEKPRIMLTTSRRGGILPETIFPTVERATFKLAAISRTVLPSPRAASTAATVSGGTGGRPLRLVDLAKPALIRSVIIDRSNSAKTPHIWNIARPLGVAVSSPCLWR